MRTARGSPRRGTQTNSYINLNAGQILGLWILNYELGTPTPRKAGGLRRAGFLFGQKFADVKLRSRGEIIEGAPQPVTTLPDRIREGGDAFLLPLYGDRELNFEQGAHDGTVLGLQLNRRQQS